MIANHWREWLPNRLWWVLTAVSVGTLLLLSPLNVRAAGDSFNIQVAPSPLVVTLKPGQLATASITVRNLSSHSETLYPKLQAFDIDAKQKISFKGNVSSSLAKWVKFKQAKLTLAPGASQPLDIIYHTPSDVGFSYSMAIILSRSNEAPTPGAVRLEGGVAVFNLINIDRPGAVRKLELDKITTSRSVYEFLPATFTVTVNNTGNVIAEPVGTLFIQRSFDDSDPQAALPLNQAGGYILPGESREFIIAWTNGFPHYVVESSADNTKAKTKLDWDWRHVSELRFGRYVAKAVMVYDDGQRDVALTASDSFWVMPWRIMAGGVLALALLGIGLIATGWWGVKAAKRVRNKVRRHGN